jgi:hypothetical protein
MLGMGIHKHREFQAVFFNAMCCIYVHRPPYPSPCCNLENVHLGQANENVLPIFVDVAAQPLSLLDGLCLVRFDLQARWK